MTTELFDIPESLSPKLAWLKQHGLVAQHFPEHEDTDEDEFGNELFPWMCMPESPVDHLKAWQGAGVGATEDDCILDYCEKHAIKHYSLP